MILTVSDITSLIKEKDDFALNEAQMHFIIDTAPIGFHWYTDREETDRKASITKFHNTAHKKITGLSDEEMTVRGIFGAITHPDDTFLQQETRKPLNNKETTHVSMEKRYLRKDGRTIWVNASWNRRWDPDGKGFEEVNSIEDITELKKAEKELRRKEAQLRFIFEASPIGLRWCYVEQLTKDSPLNYIERLTNPAHLKITGLTAEETDTLGIFKKITHPDDLSLQVFGEKQNMGYNDGAFSMEKRYIRPDGKIIWVSITWLRKWNRITHRYQELSTLIDITEEKRSSEDIVKARIAAEEANKAKSQFLSTMSHEIRTPMNGLIGVLHIMDSSTPKENEKYLRIAQKSANDLLNLINDILDFSKIESGKIRFNNQRFAIHELIEDSVEAHANSAYQKGLNVITIIPPSAATDYLGDKNRLRQVLSNLISNAVKFTESGEIEVGVRNNSTENKFIELYVKDSGIGIDLDSQDKLFQPFTQANASTTRQFGGTGLGLSICKSIISNINGEIGIESDPGNGSTFWVRIPHQEDMQPIEDLLKSPHPSKSALLIHSNPIVSEHLESWLTQWGVQITRIENTNEILTLKDEGYDYALVEKDILLTKPTDLETKRLSQFNFNKTKLVIIANPNNSKSPIDLQFNVHKTIDSPTQLRQLRSAIGGTPSSNNSSSNGEDQDLDWTNDLKAYSVLLVDDNSINRIVTTKLLFERHKIVADNANDGIQALEALRSRKYDLVLMDCMMPEMDGYDATKAIREGATGETNRNISIVALTANAMEGDKEKCLSAGMDDYLSKPIQPDALKRHLERWIRSSHQEQ